MYRVHATTTRDEFRALAAEHRVVPVTRKVLADSDAITVARICAANGSLVVTCRMDQITISPRRLKPNETCTG